jgi:transposase
VGSVLSGRSCRATAALFGVSVASVVKWSQRYRATGSAAAKRMGGHRRRILLGERVWLLARIEEKPDLTLRALLVELASRGVAISYGALWGFFASEVTRRSLSRSRRCRCALLSRRRALRHAAGRKDGV